MSKRKIKQVLEGFIEYCQANNCSTCEYKKDMTGSCLEQYCADMNSKLEEIEKRAFTRKIIYTATLLMIVVFAMMLPATIPVHKEVVCYIIIGVAGLVTDYIVTHHM